MKEFNFANIDTLQNQYREELAIIFRKQADMLTIARIYGYPISVIAYFIDNDIPLPDDMENLPSSHPELFI